VLVWEVLCLQNHDNQSAHFFYGGHREWRSGTSQNDPMSFIYHLSGTGLFGAHSLNQHRPVPLVGVCTGRLLPVISAVFCSCASPNSTRDTEERARIYSIHYTSILVPIICPNNTCTILKVHKSPQLRHTRSKRIQCISLSTSRATPPANMTPSSSSSSLTAPKSTCDCIYRDLVGEHEVT
jgi:hypothetical protein